MNVEALAAEYIKRKDLLDSLTEQVNTMKGLLTKAIDAEGELDEKGHRWFTAGKFLLQRQKRQGKKFLNPEATEEWARGKGIWDEVKIIKEEVNEDALLGWVYEHRDDPAIEQEFESLYVTPDPTWAFMPPVVQNNYEY